MPAVKPGGRPACWSRREIVSAILYVVRGGNQWRAMPHDLPPWQTAYYYFRRWRNAETWETLQGFAPGLRPSGRGAGSTPRWTGR